MNVDECLPSVLQFFLCKWLMLNVGQDTIRTFEGYGRVKVLGRCHVDQLYQTRTEEGALGRFGVFVLVVVLAAAAAVGSLLVVMMMMMMAQPRIINRLKARGNPPRLFGMVLRVSMPMIGRIEPYRER